MSTFFQEDEVVGKAYDARLTRRLLTYLGPYRRWVALIVGLLFVGALSDLAGPYILKRAIDEDIAPVLRLHTHAAATGYQRGLLTAVLLFLGSVLLTMLTNYLQRLTLAYLGQNVMYDIRVQLFGHLERLSLSFFDHNPVGRLMTRLTNDVDALNEMITSGAVAIFGDIFMLVGIIIILFALNWQLALICFAVVPVLLVITVFFRVVMRDAYREVRTRISRLNSFIAENISGAQIVQLFNRERQNFRAFDRLNDDYTKANLKSLLWFALFFPVVNLVGACAVAAIVWYGGGQVAHHILTFGALVAFLQYTDRFFNPIRDLSEKYTIMQSAMAASERIFGLLDQQPAFADPPHPQPLGEVRGSVEFRDVWFAYNPDEWVLKGISFKIEPGESVAFVGATGAGKTSLISLISRFYDVQKGQVLVDDVDVKEVAQGDLRRHVGAVLQDPFIFSGTIAFNIRLHNKEITDEQVRRAARFVNADAFINQLPSGYDEEVRERGAGLSVGQKQLISFARAIAFNPEILLVLDEATSSVDTETEFLIQDALAKLMRERGAVADRQARLTAAGAASTPNPPASGDSLAYPAPAPVASGDPLAKPALGARGKGGTTIIIAHRLSTIRNVDRIIVLHKGQVVEQGTHSELLARHGVYHRLYELQYQGME